MAAKPTCQGAGTPATPSLPRAARLRPLRGTGPRWVRHAHVPRQCTRTGCPRRYWVPDGELGLLCATLPHSPVPPNTAVLPVPTTRTTRVKPKARPTEGHCQRQAHARTARAARCVLPVCAPRLRVRVHARAALGLLLAVLGRSSLTGALPGGQGRERQPPLRLLLLLLLLLRLLPHALSLALQGGGVVDSCRPSLALLAIMQGPLLHQCGGHVTTNGHPKPCCSSVAPPSVCPHVGVSRTRAHELQQASQQHEQLPFAT